MGQYLSSSAWVFSFRFSATALSFILLVLIKTFKEANEYNGPAIVIAYAPCISHGIKGGMVNSLDIEREAVACGYFPIFRRNPITGFSLDCNPNFDLYEEFLNKQTRYTMLSKINSDNTLLDSNKEEAIKRFEYYNSLKEVK